MFFLHLGLRRNSMLFFCFFSSGLKRKKRKMRSFSYNSGFPIFTVIDFTDLFPFCLFHQFTSVSPAVPEFLKTPTPADQPPPRSTAPVLPTNTVSSAKPGPALVKVGTPHTRRTVCTVTVVCSPVHRGQRHVSASPACLVA